MSRHATFLFIVSALLGGCGAPVGAPLAPTETPSALRPHAIPSEAPSIQGAITAVDESGRIRVEESAADAVGPKAVVRIGTETKIVDGNGQAAPRSALVVGARVAVWFDGPVAQVYPLQATAGVVVIEAAR